ncbi:MAG: citrate/2-methylcitrate synthase [Armatimonadota bacterium]|nr:citrate/2-methylcitrate synthase [Armatimonadota bacterium]MDR7444755.1 citrate/2-methylcitrate synthase [Armatimonadota bacterium]MDR7569243.1 citrate/2-methylcitrate synthase [Armatimonadota bacterium]MDR7613361.1 citrate/2-methylcitrate synthase [Armatimonadota bacterium]
MPQIAKGLEGVVAGTTALSFIDGRAGRLVYCGYDIHELARKSTFEEVCFLLWYGRLPNRTELDALRRELATMRPLPRPVEELLRALPSTLDPLDALRTALSPLLAFDEGARETSREANLRRAKWLTALTSTVIAAFHRLRTGQKPVPPDPELPHAANFLYMLLGERPTPLAQRAMDAYFVLLADHGYNASTFTARVIASTLSDMVSAVCGAIGALKGPLHGGAAQWTMEMLLEIGSLENVEPYIRRLFAEHKRVPGFGHRVYRTEDPRARVLRELSRRVGEETGGLLWYEMSERVDALVAQLRGDREIYPNVDFYSASLLYNLGIPPDLMTCAFAASRVAGWTAHVLEQQADNRLYRPLSEYTGPMDLAYVPIEER